MAILNIQQLATHSQIENQTLEICYILRCMKQPREVVGQVCPRGLQFVRTGGAGDGLEGGLAQGVLHFAAGLLLFLQFVA